jgi:hypothetical protein
MNAKEMVMKRSTIAKTFTIAAVSALALGIAPTMSAADKGCSNASLQGTFAYTGTGFVVTPTARAGPFAEVGTQTFDGNGATTTTFTASGNGNLFQTVYGESRLHRHHQPRGPWTGSPCRNDRHTLLRNGRQLEWISSDRNSTGRRCHPNRTEAISGGQLETMTASGR